MYLFLFYLFLIPTRAKEQILESTITLLASDTSQVERAQSPLPVEVYSLNQFFFVLVEGYYWYKGMQRTMTASPKLYKTFYIRSILLRRRNAAI